MSALMVASQNGHSEVVKLLHEFGTQVDLQNKSGVSALMVASQNCHCEVLKQLHEFGAQVDLPDEGGWSALMIASQNGHCEVVKPLHEYGAQVDMQNKNGSSALMIAVHNKRFEIVELLQQYGAKYDPKLPLAYKSGLFPVTSLVYMVPLNFSLLKKSLFMCTSHNRNYQLLEHCQKMSNPSELLQIHNIVINTPLRIKRKSNSPI